MGRAGQHRVFRRHPADTLFCDEGRNPLFDGRRAKDPGVPHLDESATFRVLLEARLDRDRTQLIRLPSIRPWHEPEGIRESDSAQRSNRGVGNRVGDRILNRHSRELASLDRMIEEANLDQDRRHGRP